MPRTDRVPRRRLNAETRRDAILEAAVEAFRVQPYGAVKVTDIAAAAGASSALVFRYFGSKPALYAEVSRVAGQIFITRQAEALAALPEGTSIREHVKTILIAYLDLIADHPDSWANPFVAGDEPPEAIAVRTEARAYFVERLRELLDLTPGWKRHDYSLVGFFGFVDQACLEWVKRGCPKDDRWPIVEASLGSLEGALGDWRG